MRWSTRLGFPRVWFSPSVAYALTTGPGLLPCLLRSSGLLRSPPASALLEASLSVSFGDTILNFFGVRYGVPGTIQTCPDCGVLPGAIHQRDCDIEQCPNCGRQLLTCRCSDAQRACRLPWTGHYPGVAECMEFGWYAKLVPGMGWVPCDPDEPEAMEHLNSLAMDAEWDPLGMRYIKKEDRS